MKLEGIMKAGYVEEYYEKVGNLYKSVERRL